MGIRAIDIPNFKITGFIEDPSNLDYTIYGLHKKDAYTAGVITTSEFYRNYTPLTNTYTDLVVKEEIVYNRAVSGLLTHKVTTITWYMEDDSVGTTKVVTKYYPYQESMLENEHRRINLMFDVRVYLYAQIGATDTQALIDTMSTEVLKYVRGLNQPLIDAIQAAEEVYLTQEIKDHVINIIDI